MQEIYYEEEMPLSTEKRNHVTEIQDEMIKQGKSPEQIKQRLEEEFDESYADLMQKVIKFDKKHHEAIQRTVEKSDVIPEDEKEDLEELMKRVKTKIEFMEKTYDIDQGEE